MNIKTTLPATKIRKDFFNVLDRVEKTNIPYTITVNGQPKAVIMNAEEYEGWLETMDIISNPETVRGIEEGKKDLAEGRYSTFEEVFNMSPQNALSIADRGKKKYDSKRKN